jgi:putative transposase
MQQDSISRLSRALGSRYAQHINKTYKRTGTLWEGRHKSSAVDSESYLLKCYRYIELNPVTAGMVTRPEEYRWTSYNVNTRGDSTDLILFHDEYLNLGEDSTRSYFAYRELFRGHLSEEDMHTIRKGTHYCQPLGDDRFRRQTEEKTGGKLGMMARGRPKKWLINNPSVPFFTIGVVIRLGNKQKVHFFT